MKRQILSLLCALVLLLGAAPSAAALEGDSQRAADTLITLDLIQQSYGSAAPASRTMAAAVLARLSGADFFAKAENALAYVSGQGWLTRTVPQDSAVSADEWFGALLRMMGHDLEDQGAALYARRAGLAARDYSGPMTQGQVLQSALDALDFSFAGEEQRLIDRLIEQGVCSQTTASALGLFSRELTARQAADRHMAAVFRLDTYYTDKAFREEKSSSGGSGFFISADGLAVTNYHTIEGAVRATATLVTGETFEVERVLYYDDEADLAILRISKTTKDRKTTVPFFSFLEIAQDPDLRRGDVVYTLGVPLGLTLAISDGVVSSAEHEVEGYTYPCVVNTADISHGSSGGVLMNVYGHVVGVTTGAYSAGNNLYISVPLIPVLEADLTVEGVSLAQVVKDMDLQ